MDTTKQIKDGPDQTSLQLPMGQLFYLLYSNGFRVKPDDYIEMLKITERFGSKNIDETAKWICPIIATSEIEQAKFYNIIEQYKKLTNAQVVKEEEKKKPIPRYIKIAIAVAAAAMLLLIIFLFIPKKIYQLAEETSKERSIEKGEALMLDASNLLQDHPEDTSNIKFAWQFEDSSKEQGVKVAHVFKKPGDYIVKREFASDKISLPKRSDSLLIHVCNDLPKVNIRLPQGVVYPQQYFNLTADVDAEPGTVKYYQWKINDSTILEREPKVVNVSFDKKGDYNISCTAVVDTLGSTCSVTDNEIVHIQDGGIHYAANFSAPRPGSYQPKTKLKWWVTLAFLLPAAAGLLYSVLKRKNRKAKAEQIKQSPAQVNKGPFDIPFEQNDIKLIQQERELRQTLIQMRYKAEEETLVLNVPGTISSIIRSGGSPQLVYAPLTQQQQYLLLIDRSNPKGMLSHLAGYLAKTVADDGIPVTVFYYDKNFVCYNDKFPGGLTLQRLAETDSASTLIIIGKAQELVYSAYPVIEEQFLRELNRWQHKAIVTPTPVKDWGVKEGILQEYMILVPADVISLQKIIPALREKIKPHTGIFEITDEDQYSLRNTDFQDIDELKKYLNNDETMFQWLCAICIYPRVKWEVLVEIGKAILDKYGAPEKLNYSSLLKLCRISWMQQGVFPQMTRLELLKQLTIENELCARERLLHMLNYSTSIYGENGHFFEEEKKRQQLTNQFILHANNNVQYSQYAGSKEAFKKIWKKDAILDMPVKKYLDKKGNDNWQTPINNGNESVGLSAYFDLHEIQLNKTIRLKRVLAAAVAVLLIGVWSYIGYGGGAEKLSPLIALNQDIGKQAVPITIKVVKDFAPCGDSVKTALPQLDGYMEIGVDRIPVAYNPSTAIASFNVPYESIATGKANMVFTWDSNKTVMVPAIFKNQLMPDSVTISCVNINSSPPIQIRYNDTSGYKDIETALGDALFRFRIANALQSDFTDSSRIIYYEPNQKSRADSVVQIMKDQLGIHVNEEYISELRTPPAIPILFINTTHDSIPIPEDANYYHSMGDEAFQRKAYQEAIQSYKRAIAINPKDALAYYQSGMCYEMLGDSYALQAIEEYDAAIAANPNDGLFWYRRASVKYGLKRYADAIRDFNKVISLNSDDTKRQYSLSLYYRGKSYYYLKNTTSACTDFIRAADMGVTAAKKDYDAYCGNETATAKPPAQTDFGDIELDQNGYTNAAGQQVMERVSRLLKAQPQGKIRLSASYTNSEEQKRLTGYMNTIVNMFAKIGVNTKTQIEQQLNKGPDIKNKGLIPNARAMQSKTVSIHVTGLNINVNQQNAARKS